MPDPLDRSRPVMIFDGDCGFCRRWIQTWNRMTGDRVLYFPYQQVQRDFPDIPEGDFKKAVQLVMPDGVRYQGAEAVFRSLASASVHTWLIKLYRNVPLFAIASEGFYRLVARNRVLFSRLTRFFWAGKPEETRFRASRWLFIRGLGLIYLFAFFSLFVQAEGLWGDQGVLPAADYLKKIYDYFGLKSYYLVPSLAWLHPGGSFLEWLCAAGMAASLLVIAGIASGPALLFLWVCYLSFVSIGRDFLSFQWDVLLLETGFLALFLAPFNPLRRDRLSFPMPGSFHFLLRWLLFRLMFSSGVVKIASGDPSWKNLNALQYHYETQPLPAWTSWYAHHWPDAVHSVSAAAMFFIEIVLSFGILGPRPLRLAACAGVGGLQLMIMATGNYCFFNFLSLLLCLLLVDDGVWSKLVPEKIRAAFPGRKTGREPHDAGAAAPRRRKIPLRVTAALLFLLSLAPVYRLAGAYSAMPSPLKLVNAWLSPFHLTNSYGLFAVMTTVRPEIILEGSMDGRTWTAYEFKYKPGSLERRPVFVQPHQPRLDWQMWFAALSPAGSQPWFLEFCVRLLQGSPEVENLLAFSPFGGNPPKYLRAVLYQYRFTSPRERRNTGHYWKREYMEMYLPPISLRDSGAAASARV